MGVGGTSLSLLVTQWCVGARNSVSATLDGLASSGSLLTLCRLVSGKRWKSGMLPDSGSSSLPGCVYPKQVGALQAWGVMVYRSAERVRSYPTRGRWVWAEAHLDRGSVGGMLHVSYTQSV